MLHPASAVDQVFNKLAVKGRRGEKVRRLHGERWVGRKVCLRKEGGVYSLAAPIPPGEDRRHCAGLVDSLLSSPLFPAKPQQLSAMSTFAVINDRGRRFRVAPGNEIWIDLRKDAADGSKIIFNNVELVSVAGAVRVGTPTVPGVEVVGEVEGSKNGKKMVVYKYKRRKNTRRRWGARARYTRVSIAEIKGA